MYRLSSIKCDFKTPFFFTYRTGQDLQRLQFFNDSLIYLSLASSKGFQAFKECSTLIKNKLQGFPLDVSQDVLDIKLDKVSMDIFPSQEFPELVPIKVSGDGNCLPRSASMLVFGDQHHNVEMRVRMACELALNKDFYLNDVNHKIYDFDTFPYCSTITTYSANFKPGMNSDPESIEKVYELDAIKTAKRGNYCGIWHLYALASVVGCKLYSIYPKLKSTVSIRPELNRIIFPRKQLSKRKLAVFWTNTNGINGENYWSPNHFAPCLHKHLLLEVKQKADIKKIKTENVLEDRRITRCRSQSASLASMNGVERHSIVASNLHTPSKRCISGSRTPNIEKRTQKTTTPNIEKKTQKTATPNMKAVRFNVESKCDLAIHFLTKKSNKIQIKNLKRHKNPLKSIFKFFMGNQKESRGPDVSFYEIE